MKKLSLMILVIVGTLFIEGQAQNRTLLLFLSAIPGNLFINNHPILNFSIITRADAKPVLRWQSPILKGNSFFTIERSIDGIQYDAIGVLKCNSADSKGFFEFADEAPIRGKLYYRLKFTSDKQVFFSEVIFNQFSEDSACKFYPNPVDKLLIVRSEKAVEIQVFTELGKSLIFTKLEAGLQVIDVSALPTGNYIINLVQKEANKIITERLIKK